MQRKLNEKLKVNKNIATRKKDFAVKVHRIIIKFRKTVSFRIMNKITVNRKYKGLTKTEPRDRYLP